MSDILKLIDKLNLEEKIALLAGHNNMFTNAIPRLNIPSIRMSDGPHGLRILNEGEDGVVGTSKATCFPAASTSSNSFNPSLLKEMGIAMGEEASFYHIDVILGPGINIKRNPLGGRNFEYFSEDPLLSGLLGANQVEGIESTHTSACIKHFALNNEENHRFIGDSIADNRAIREIYLKPFEYAIKLGKPHSVMNAYNKINGIYCSENKWLLTDVLRNEWGFNGLVLTDWGATHNRINALKAGNDLEMPGDSLICRKWIYDAINNHELDIKDLDERVNNVLSLVSLKTNHEYLKEVDFDKHHSLAALIAEESAVLLKNDNVLPLKENERLCVVGELFEKMRYQGLGSSMVTSYKETSIKDAFDINNINYTYFKGYKENSSEVNESLIKEVIDGTNDFDKVIVFMGLTDDQESEGGDRDDMSLPNNQLALINSLIKKNKKIIVVLFGGSVVELPFFDDINGLLNMFLPGQNGGLATYNILFGKTNPSGRLSETWPISYLDVPFGKSFSKEKDVIYKESIYVGYRYYLSKGIEVRFPFGYGLSYTSFEYSNLHTLEDKDNIKVTLDIKNIGEYDGKEVVQIYIKGPDTSFYKPIRELKGFTKVDLKIGEVKKVEINISKDSLKYWNDLDNKYSLEKGEYIIQVGKSSKDIILEQPIYLDGDNLDNVYPQDISDIYKGVRLEEVTDEVFMKMSKVNINKDNRLRPFTLESRLIDLKKSFIGRIIFNKVMKDNQKEMKEILKLEEGKEKDSRLRGALAVKKILENSSLIAMSMSSGNKVPYNIVEGYLLLANGHIFKGLKKLKEKIIAPKLPSNK